MKNRILLFGGVYSNLQALEKMKEIADREGFSPSDVICNGDVVGYCAQPEECIQMIKKWDIKCITGNVELQLREGLEDCGCDFDAGSRCDIFSRQWYPYAQKSISKDSLNWLKEMPEYLKFKVGEKEIAVVHGAKSNVSAFIFESTDWDLKQKEFDLTQTDVIIAGHCGLPFSQSKNDQYWINPGVIGMPANDGNRHVWYAILEIQKGEISIEHHSFQYQSETANRLMKEQQLPQEYAKTLLSGLWDNCEILPEAETNAQGLLLQPITTYP